MTGVAAVAALLLTSRNSAWKPSGKLAFAIDAKGNVASSAYDLLDRRVSTTDAMGRVTRFRRCHGQVLCLELQKLDLHAHDSRQ